MERNTLAVVLAAATTILAAPSFADDPARRWKAEATTTGCLLPNPLVLL